MTQLNLLPWRITKTKRDNKKIIILIVGCVLLGVMLSMVGYKIADHIARHQLSRNQFMEGQIADIDDKLQVIKDLETKEKSLAERMSAISPLEKQRPLVVEIFKVIAKSMPSKLYLTRFELKNQQIQLEGFTQNNQQISEFMRKLALSPLLHTPTLNSVKALESNSKNFEAVNFPRHFVVTVLYELPPEGLQIHGMDRDNKAITTY